MDVWFAMLMGDSQLNLGDCTITMVELLLYMNELKVLKDCDLLGLPLPQFG